MDSDLTLVYVPPPWMQNLQPCQISCRCPEARTGWGPRSPMPAALASLGFPGAASPCSLQEQLHLLAAFPAPSPLLLFKAVSKRGVRPPGWPVRSQEPRRTDVTAWLVSRCVLRVWAQPHGMRTRSDLWERKGGLDYFFFFWLAFFCIL